MKDKFVITITVAFGVLLVSLLLLWTETKNYKYSSDLPEVFDMVEKEATFNLGREELVCIMNNFTNRNISLQVDNRLEDEIRITFKYYKTNKTSYTQKYDSKDDNKSYINFKSDFKLNRDNISDVFNLGSKMMEDKTIYNYSLLKYSKIVVYVNEDNVNKIKFARENSYFCSSSGWNDIKWY